MKYIESNLCLMVNKFSQNIMTWRFMSLFDGIYHTFILLHFVSSYLHRRRVYMPDIFLRANRCIMDYPLTIPNRQTFDTSKKYLVFLHSASFTHFFTLNAFTFQYKTILSRYFHLQELELGVSHFKEFLFCNLQRMWKCMSQNFGSFITDKIVSCCL